MNTRILPWLVVGGVLLGACGDEPPVELPEPLFGSVEIEFPEELWDDGIEGETIVLVLVSALGNADSVSVAVPSDHTPFDSAAVAAAREIRFSPGRRGEKRIDMWVQLPIRFALDGDVGIGAPVGAPVDEDANVPRSVADPSPASVRGGDDIARDGGVSGGRP